MSHIDNLIRTIGEEVIIRHFIETIDNKGYRTKTHEDSEVKAVLNELTGLEYMWDISGMTQPGDKQAFFESDVEVEIGDIVIDSEEYLWEVVQLWIRKDPFSGNIIYKEGVIRKK